MYTFNKYYPTSEVTDRTIDNLYTAYKEFVQGNEILQRRFDCTYNDSDYAITLTPKEECAKNKPFVISLNSASSAINLCGYCTVLGTSYSTSNNTPHCYANIANTDACFYIVESDDFLGLCVGDNFINSGAMQYMLIGGQKHFDGSADDFVTVQTYYRVTSTSSTSTTGYYVTKTVNGTTTLLKSGPYTSTDQRNCTSNSDNYCLTRVIDGGSITDIIYDNLYTIEGGLSLPPFGAPFKIGSDTFLMVYLNVCVKLN